MGFYGYLQYDANNHPMYIDKEVVYISLVISAHGETILM